MTRSQQPIWDLMWYKAVADIKAEASRAYIGLLWWIVEPVLYMFVFYLIFAVGFRTGGDGFVYFLLAGLVPWKWFQSSVSAGSNVITANHGLISQIYFPKYMLIGVVAIANLLKFMIIMALFLVFLIVSGIEPTWGWLQAIPLICSLLILIVGIVSITASLTPFLPDLKLIIDNLLLLTFFSSGIFYDVSTQSPELQEILKFNPLVSWITEFRVVFLEQGRIEYDVVFQVGLFGLVLMLIGFRMLFKWDRKFAKVVP